MLPTEELYFKTVLRSAQDQADAMLACGGALRPTALLMRMKPGVEIDEAALVDVSEYDEATLRAFMRTNAGRPDVHAIALSTMVDLPLSGPGADAAASDIQPMRAVMIHLLAHQRETVVTNDIDPVTGRLRRGQFDPTRLRRIFLDAPADD